MGNEEILERLGELYSQKVVLMEEMLRITSRMTSLDQAEMALEILDLLEERQECINRVDGVDAQIRLFEKNIVDINPGGMARGPSGDDERIKGQQSCILSLVTEIQRLDRDHLPRLNRMLSEARVIREKLMIGRSTAGAYLSHKSSVKSIFIDRKE